MSCSIFIKTESSVVNANITFLSKNYVTLSQLIFFSYTLTQPSQFKTRFLADILIGLINWRSDDVHADFGKARFFGHVAIFYKISDEGNRPYFALPTKNRPQPLGCDRF